jgi:hypothetical protein
MRTNILASGRTGTKVEPQQGVLGNAMDMANALVANPAWVTSSSFLTTANAGASDVFSTPLTFFPTGGDSNYVALSNGLTSSIPFPATFAVDVLNITWTCTGTGGAVCSASGSGSLYDTLTSLPADGSVTYVVKANVMLASADCDVSITPPVSVNDPNLANNRAIYHIYRMMIPYVINNRKP